MQALKLVAGRKAQERLGEAGLTPEILRLVLGASGGPKWLVLAGLDRVIFGEFLKKAAQPVALFGSSIGAWRMSVAAHPEPDRMAAHFKDVYLNMEFDVKVNTETVTRESYQVLETIFSASDKRAIVENSAHRPLHIVAAKGKGMAGSRSQIAESAGILAAAAANATDRKRLRWFYDRAIFHTSEKICFRDRLDDFGCVDARLTEANLFDSLMASGSIPSVIEPITDIEGAPAGVYRDGGIIDYHFSTDWRLEEGICLFPHFYSSLTPGWFDKKLKRRAGMDALESVLLLAPSADFVRSLPEGRIPERKDFSLYTNRQRKKIWKKVAMESERLADEFNELLEDHGSFMDRLEVAA